jgi:hypothetical protein
MGGGGKVRPVPFVDVVLERAQVGLAAIQLNDPDQLCGDLLAGSNIGVPDM